MGSLSVGTIPFVPNIEWASQILGKGFPKALRQQLFSHIQEPFPGGRNFSPFSAVMKKKLCNIS